MTHMTSVHAGSQCLICAMVFLGTAASAQTTNLGLKPSAPIEGPTRITHERPAWLREGIVIAGNWSNWMQRQQRIHVPWTQTGYGLSDTDALTAYRAEMSPEMVERLKRLGVTLVLMPLFSGMGSPEEERPGMEDAKRFAEHVHAAGMRVGVYIHQGMLSRGFLEALPEAYEWLAWPKPDGNFTGPPPPATQSEGYPVYRNHPGYQQFMRGIIDYAIREVKADFLHFDNYVYTSGFGPRAIDDFRDYLRAKFTPEQLHEHFGGRELTDVARQAYAGQRPMSLEWEEFQAWVLAESYRKLADYARSLRADVATEVNASGLTLGFRRPIDLSQLVPNADCFWDEQPRLGWNAEKQQLNTSIRTLKLARLYQQNALLYGTSRLAVCESLAFNYDALGCLYWFQYNRLNWPVTVDHTADDRYLPETRFYLDHRDLFGSGRSIVDVAVLRSRAVHLYGPEDAIYRAYLFEQMLISRHVPFELIFDQHLTDLARYRAVVLPDVRMMEDAQIERVLRYVEDGGNLIMTDETAAEDRWGRPQKAPFRRLLKQPPGEHTTSWEPRGKGRIIHTRIALPQKLEAGALPENGDALLKALVQVMGEPTVRSTAPPNLAMECIRQPNRLLLNLLDYAQPSGSRPIRVQIADTAGRIRGGRLLAPRKNEIPLATAKRDGFTEITIPGFDIYAVAVLELE